ncbi:HlyD family type I secretion periplasmic adaptor subunit [Alteromonas sp. 1_MG-2023]|uniref:HlyD family type I secretion periplasmic adaptor subunit n=1 Tax=Alteromonas sp. 1_MG-2023 TaxID=3062669 RepID=UPI0026E42C0F|nr:HlyD family type I secretion periplasmic adaptor subunit [Alteromonas sp. 1_MG-2023]MDO6477337.1 HlyD family type I secretion periplasmic adaptor subunit [Alteromonas sp. 1_MG-2023]
MLMSWAREWLAPPPENDWVLEAEWARIQQRPLRAKALLYVVVLTITALIVWACFAPIAEVARGEGKVVPSSQLQILQSYDGGIVQDIQVREGQKVNAGDIILKVDPTRYLSSLQENNSKRNAVAAKVHRLTAQSRAQPLSFPEELKQAAPEIVANETALYFSSVKELEETLSRFESRIAQRRQDLQSYRAELQQYQDTLSIAQRELTVTRPLMASGAVSEIDILRLEKQVIENQGAIQRTRAAITRSQATIDEEQNNLKEASLKMQNRWNEELNEAVATMQSLQESQTGLEDVVKQSEIRAPVAGTVQRLLVNTVGGVVTPGSAVVEIIPADDRLIVEAKIPPKDIAFLKLGQPAILKFSAYDFAIYGGMKASVEHISADTVTDDQDRTYYLVRLSTEDKNALNMDILPGMMVQVDIITGNRTVMQYLLNPLIRASASALGER